MKNRFFLLAYNTVFLLLIVAVFTPSNSWGQDNPTDKVIYKEGRISDALHASMIPDNRTVGVYLTVAKQNEHSPQEWASIIEKYFTAYGFPVKIILDHKRPEGKGAAALIYVGAKAYIGNLSSRGVSLNYFLTEHKKVFGELLALYKEANPDLVDTQK